MRKKPDGHEYLSAGVEISGLSGELAVESAWRRREIASNAARSSWSRLTPDERSEDAYARWSAMSHRLWQAGKLRSALIDA